QKDQRVKPALMDDRLARLQHPLDITHRVLPSSPCRADAPGCRPMPQARAASRPARANVAASAALLQHVSRTAPPPSPRPTAIGNEHAAPQADRDPAFDRRGEPCGPALGRDLERLVYRAAADLGPGLLVFGR